jgi:hypothetical protein
MEGIFLLLVIPAEAGIQTLNLAKSEDVGNETNQNQRPPQSL